jgi:hypothetical protein
MIGTFAAVLVFTMLKEAYEVIKNRMTLFRIFSVTSRIKKSITGPLKFLTIKRGGL